MLINTANAGLAPEMPSVMSDLLSPLRFAATIAYPAMLDIGGGTR